ncbi:MAG: hypothetical protein HY582_00610, partial [Candidatus Omnitrophica bacterium]|nr:hypothetical protein [Candidatus Omnitrophota bacterium]
MRYTLPSKIIGWCSAKQRSEIRLTKRCLKQIRQRFVAEKELYLVMKLSSPTVKIIALTLLITFSFSSIVSPSDTPLLASKVESAFASLTRPMVSQSVRAELRELLGLPQEPSTKLVSSTPRVIIDPELQTENKKFQKPRAELRSDGFTQEEIDERMTKDGFPELRFLWNHFKKLKIDLQNIDEAKLEKMRVKHTSALIKNSFLHALAFGGMMIIGFLLIEAAIPYLISLAMFASLGFFETPQIMQHLKEPIPATFVEWLKAGISSVGLAAILYMFSVFIKRILVYSWKTISAIELAQMLKMKNFRDWFNQTERANQTIRRLRSLGVNENWDNPDYKIQYQMDQNEIVEVPIGNQTIPEFTQNVLRSVLGTKENRQFKPGQFTPNLKDGQKSVTEFVNAHKEELARNRNGELSVEDGKKLLQELMDQYLVPNSAGDQYVRKAIQRIENWDSLPEGVVEAQIWQRDPWVDLTHQKDFFSSASLRGNAWIDALNRRTKGALGPFNYLRNKSISALDFKTRGGRRVRVRMAAAVYQNQDGKDESILFVDGVEGRFDVRPKLIKKAIENYARAPGFNAVFYFAYPLNQVPKRFVEYLKSLGMTPEELSIEYVDSSAREYLDAFGKPVEPWEYAFPKGKVMGYVTELRPTDRSIVRPGKLKLWWNGAKKKHFLTLLVAGPILIAGWVIGSSSPETLLPFGIVIGGMLFYQYKLARRSVTKSKDRRLGRAELRAVENPPFVEKIKSEISANPVAQKMSYLARLQKKVDTLLTYFPVPSARLRHFFEEILCNISVKDSELENVLKFLLSLKEEEKRKTAERIFAAVWSKPNPEAKQIGLSEDKVSRDKLKKELFAKIEVVRKFVKATDLKKKEVLQIVKMQKRLKISILEVLNIVTISPPILQGLSKPPRPIYAWILPVTVALSVTYLTTFYFLTLPMWVPTVLLAGISILGTILASTRLNIAPGILYYKKTRTFLSQVIAGSRPKTEIEKKMETLGIQISEFGKHQVYEDSEKGVRIIVRDKKTLEDAVKFLTSSESIDNCIALKNFVSWTLPSLLDDDGIVLADIYYRATNKGYQHGGQMWMIASEENGAPVLTVNSFEFNNEGANHIDLVMPEAVKVLQAMARRARFQKIYVGITDFGRSYLDKNFPQGTTQNRIVKIHSPKEAGFTYYFDAFSLKRSFRHGQFVREYVYEKKRGPAKRLYAIIFGLIEFAKRNTAKTRAFFDSAANPNNFWEIPLTGSKSEDSRAELRQKDGGQNSTTSDLNPTDPDEPESQFPTMHWLITWGALALSLSAWNVVMEYRTWSNQDPAHPYSNVLGWLPDFILPFMLIQFHLVL